MDANLKAMTEYAIKIYRTDKEKYIEVKKKLENKGIII